MSRCKKACNTSELLPAFAAEAMARGIEEVRVTAALNRLCEYAAEAERLLCEIRLAGMQDFVRQLYNLEDGDYTADDSCQEIHIITLFYDYLVSLGCVAANPVIRLKDAALLQLMERMAEHGYRKELSKENNNPQAEGDKNA